MSVCVCVCVNSSDHKTSFNTLIKIFPFFKNVFTYIFFTLIAEDGSTIVVRHCADADWGRHCGAIWFEKSESGEHERMYGCLVACDKDGCNGSGRRQPANLLLLVGMSVAVTLRVWLSVWSATRTVLFAAWTQQKSKMKKKINKARTITR